MEFVILGPTALHIDGETLHLGAAKQRGMLAVLLYHVGEPVRIDTIVEHLWDGRTPDEHRTSLYALASRTRAVLLRAGLGDALVRVPSTGAYRLDADPDMIDFHRFRRMVSEAREAARRHDHHASTALLTRAIALWRDEPLADLRGARSEHVRRHMKDGLLDAQRLWADSQLRTGGHESVLVRLEPLVRAHEIDEALAQHWITALCAAGREDEARTFYLAFRRRFRKDMHIEPAVQLPSSAQGPPLSRPGLGGGKPGRLGAPGVAFVPPRQLPKDITDFTGHEKLLAELDVLTNSRDKKANVMVISGMPGVGKTTLAIHWAHRQRHWFPDGELYLNANGYGPTSTVEPDDALGRFLYALDVPPDRVPADRAQRRERLNQILSGRRVLIILDNIGAPDQARPLIPTSDGCVTLITSRNRLTGLAIREGVRCITVPPLSEQESLALLDQMVGTTRAGTEPEAMGALARISGGLPLALRIIGEHVAERPRARIADLVDELGNHLLDIEQADDETSLHTVFAWSYNALGPDAARLYRLLGVLPGSNITPEAAAATSGTTAQHAEHLLNILAKAHLINHDTARRYRFHDLLRRFAANRARREEPSDHVFDSLCRLLDWYLLSSVNAAAVLAPHLPPVPDLPQPTDIKPQGFLTEADAMTWCEAERENLGEVTRWAAGHGFYRHAWQIPGTIHEIFDRYGRQDDVIELQELALTAARIDRHQMAEIGTLNNLGAAYFAIHDYGRATANFEACLRLARGVGYVEGETACSLNLASVHLRACNIVAAVGLCERVLTICRETSNAEGESAALQRLGDASRRMKQYDQAARYYQEALAIRERICFLRAQGATHGDLAALYLETGQWELAFEHCRHALDIHGRTKDEAARCDALTIMADIQRELTMHNEAVNDAQQAVSISEEIADPHRRSRALAVLAHALAAAGKTRAADRVCVEALKILDEVNDPEAHPLRERVLAVRRSLTPPEPLADPTPP